MSDSKENKLGKPASQYLSDTKTTKIGKPASQYLTTDTDNIVDTNDAHQNFDTESEIYLKIHLQQGENLCKKEMWEDAISEFKKALQLSPKNTEIYIKIGKTYENLAKHYGNEIFLKNAMEQYWQAIDINPYLIDAHENLLALATKVKKTADLAQAYKAKLSKDPSIKIFDKYLNKIHLISTMSTTINTRNLSITKKHIKLFTDFVLFAFTLLLLLTAFLRKYYLRSVTSTDTISGYVTIGSFFLLVFLIIRKILNYQKANK